MTKGIEIQEVALGVGEVATRDKTVVVNVRMFLHHGTEVTYSAPFGPRMKIDLARRDCIAGLRQGIEGMRVGGVRSIIIPPHLAYGEKGVPGRIPPNALLRCEVELREIRERGVVKPEDVPLGKSLLVSNGGGAARGLPWWQFIAREDARCGASFVRPIPGLHWKHTPRKGVDIHLSADQISSLIQSAMEFPEKFPADCIAREKLRSGTTEQGFPYTFGGDDEKPCVTVAVYEKRVTLCNYSVQEDSVALLGSSFFIVISTQLKPYFDREVATPAPFPQTMRLPD